MNNNFNFLFFFKQKTAYEIMPSLVGSEMCIRDSFVTGHVDGVARLWEVREAPGAKDFYFLPPKALAPYIAEKGSVALNGVSLTVAGLTGEAFWVTLIPHTLEVTNLGRLRVGDGVNLEVDLIARYVARLLGRA